MSDIEARLQRIEDLLEIQQLFIDYGAHLDAGRFDEYAVLFSRDGEVSLGPMGRATGPDAIKQLMVTALGTTQGESFHLISSPIVQLDGDAATSEVMWSVIRRDDAGNPHLGMLGRHRDKLVREDGRWKFRERRGFMDLPSVHPDAR